MTSSINSDFSINSDALEKIDCPLCTCKESSVLFGAFRGGFEINRMFKIVKCCNCGLIYLSHRVKKTFIKSYYPESYYQVNTGDPEAILKTPHEKEKLILMKSFGLLEDNKKSLLDIGCNKGEFLENLKRLGWNALDGVEFDKDCVEFAKARYNLDVFMGEFKDYSDNKKFDIITFWHSLEHLYDINSAIKKGAGLLKQNGTIVISVPNIKSIQAHMMGRHWYHIDLPRHIVFFEKHTLKKLLRNYNFVIKDRTYKYPAHNLYGWYNSFLNVYNGFKRKTDKGEKIHQEAAPGRKLSLAKLTLLRILKGCMSLLSYAEMTLGSGGVITIAAKRESENAGNNI